jgi:hypothetical protein
MSENTEVKIRKSQRDRIRLHLEQGHSLTQLEALNLFGCFRLGARILELKKTGYAIRGRVIHDPVSKKRFSQYTLVA